MSEWLNLTAFLRTVHSEVHIVHISREIVANTLDSLSIFTKITHNLQATINLRKIYQKWNTQKYRRSFSWLIIGDGSSTSVYNVANCIHIPPSWASHGALLIGYWEKMVSVYREHSCNIYIYIFFKIDNESAMAMAMVWRRINDRALSQARLFHFTDARMRHCASRMFIIYL